MRAFLNHIELWLSALGLVVIWMVPILFSSPGTAQWQITAITATVVGVLHGLIFWAVRRRQRMVRNEAIQEITRMLQDRINNDLAVILMHLSADRAFSETHSTLLQSVQSRVKNISEQVSLLSEESLQSWKGRYAGVELPR
jgi:Na+/melibiose symporter-like transporter